MGNLEYESGNIECGVKKEENEQNFTKNRFNDIKGVWSEYSIIVVSQYNSVPLYKSQIWGHAYANTNKMDPQRANKTLLPNLSTAILTKFPISK